MKTVSLIDSLLSFFDSTLSHPSAIVFTMSEHSRRTWTKQDGKDASRLLAELAKRADKASGGFERPEKIHDSGTGPSSTGENAAEGSAQRRGKALHPRQLPGEVAGEKVTGGSRGGESLPVSAHGVGGDGLRRLVLEVSNDNRHEGKPPWEKLTNRVQ